MHLTFLFVSFIRAAAALPAAGPIPVNSSLQLHTFLSAVPEMPDEQWHGIAAYRRPSVAAVPTMMACVEAMHALSGLESITLLTNDQRWTHPRFPGVVVSLHGYMRTTARFAMWVVAFAIRDMLSRNRFEEAYFIGAWQGVRVASLHINRLEHVDGDAWKEQHDDSADLTDRTAVAATKPSSSSITSSLFGSRNDSSSSSSNRSSNNLVPSLTDDELLAYVHYLPTPIDRKNIFMAIVWLMLALAPFYHDPLFVFRCNVDAIGAEVRTIWNRVRDPAAAAPAPTLLIAGDVINMIARLPETLLREEKFSEMNIDMLEGEVLLGKGAVRVGPKPPRPPRRAAVGGVVARS
ncbi:MAG: hypothetical protein Q9210_005369 [Variospora velana]